MRKNLFLSCMMACGVVVFAQQNDPVLMTIDNKPVTRSEFEYIYNKNRSVNTGEQLSLDDYVGLFINFKLKVAEAQSLGLDTTRAFQNEFEGYRQQVAAGYLTDTDADEAYAHQQYDSLAQCGEWTRVRVAHIFKYLPQNAPEVMKERLQVTMDSIYNALQNGASFAELAKKCSDDRNSSAEGGMLPWISRRQAIPEFEKVAFELAPNTYSRPFTSFNGFHLVMKYNQEEAPFEKVKDAILSMRVRQGLMSKGQEVLVAKLRNEYGLDSNYSDQQVLEYEDKRLEVKYPDFAHLMQEYKDGILLFEISKEQVWDRAGEDTVGLATYFAAHKRKYDWDAPHFKGVVVHSRDKATMKKAKQMLKKSEYPEWGEILQKSFNTKDSIAVRAQIGLFVKGTNKYVDAKYFKGEAAEPIKDFPFILIYGKMLKKSPEVYTDVKGQVIADYQNFLEAQWIDQLKKKYTVIINQDVLKTVNNH